MNGVKKPPCISGEGKGIMADSEIKSKTTAHLKEKWGKRTCPMCHSRTGGWAIEEQFQALVAWEATGGFSPQKGGMPVIPVVCGSCGFTALVSAVVAKVIE